MADEIGRKEMTMKKNSRIQLKDMNETTKRMGQRELAVAELKNISGGQPSQGGTTSDSADTDQ